MPNVLTFKPCRSCPNPKVCAKVGRCVKQKRGY